MARFEAIVSRISLADVSWQLDKSTYMFILRTCSLEKSLKDPWGFVWYKSCVFEGKWVEGYTHPGRSSVHDWLKIGYITLILDVFQIGGTYFWRNLASPNLVCWQVLVYQVAFGWYQHVSLSILYVYNIYIYIVPWMNLRVTPALEIAGLIRGLCLDSQSYGAIF